jgi:CubicO group peptidase (beta-lactamase class C family)
MSWIQTTRFALMLVLAASCMPQQPNPLDLQQKIESAMNAELAEGFSGAALVAAGDKIIFDRAYGSVREVTMTTESRFWLSSTAKQFVSAAILKSEEKGWLKLDDSLNSIFPAAPADKAGITIRQLLSHTSGLGQDYTTESVASRDEAIAAIFSLPLELQPGSKFVYSNANYQLAAAIVEIVSGRRFADFLYEQLLLPTGLVNTGQTDETVFSSVAPVALQTPDRLKSRQWGAQGMYSTTHDLLRWYRALAESQILTPASTQQLFGATVPIGEGAAALGWFEGSAASTGTYRFTRGNDDYGPNSLIYAYPERDFVVIVLTHAGQKNDDISYSRAALVAIERAIFD